MDNDTKNDVITESENDTENEKIKVNYTRKTVLIFSAIIAVVCFLLFLFCYKYAYNDGGIIPPSFGVQVYHFFIVVIAIFFALMLKLALGKGLKLWVLLIASVLVPVMCYQLNYHTLKKDGIFYPLVDEGGIFHFIVIGDYDFDGMNDEMHYRLYEERTESSMYADNGDVVRNMRTVVRGIGHGVGGCFISYDEEKDNRTKLHLSTTAELKHIKLEVSFYDPATAQKISFYEVTEDGEVKVEHTINEEGKVVIYFDAKACAEYQSRGEEGKDFVNIMFRFEVEE